MRFNAFRECGEKQKNGVAFSIGQAAFSIRRWGTRESEKKIAELRRALFGAFSGDPDYFPELIANWLADYGVAGWVGVLDDETELPLEYSPRVAREVFLNESYWLKLNMDLFQAAQDYELFLEDLAVEDCEEIKK